MILHSLLISFLVALLPGPPAFSEATPAALSCPVSEPIGDRPEIDPFPTDASLYYEDGIWVTIPQDGTVILTPEDTIQIGPTAGWRSTEVMWLRDRGVEGFIEVTGKRLDKPSEESPRTPLSPQRQYVRVGQVTTGLAFPSEGCWEVTGRAASSSAGDDHSITWVVDVRFVEAEATQSSFAT